MGKIIAGLATGVVVVAAGTVVAVVAVANLAGGWVRVVVPPKR